jgi:hypothetical protein
MQVKARRLPRHETGCEPHPDMPMEYRVDPLPSDLDLLPLFDAMVVEDPAAMVDRDGGGLRIFTFLPAPALLRALARGGLAVESWQLRLLPSVCCGGCSG